MEFNFILKDNRPLDLIVLKLTDEQNNVHYIPTPLRISHNMWDEQKERPKNIYLKSEKKLNARLDRIRIGIADYLRELTVHKKCLSLATLARRIKKHAEPNSFPYSKGSLLYSMYTYIHSRQHLITHSTFKRYMVFFHLLERYEGYRKKILMIEEVNGNFVKDFMTFGESEHYCRSTVFRTIHFVRTILNYLEKRGIRTYVYELELPKEKKRGESFITLSEDEIIAISKTKVPESLKAAKDWLVVSCYTGQRVSDFMNFDLKATEMVNGKPCLSFVQQKTQKNILLPIHPIVSDILLRNSNGFPEKLPVHKYNEQIKEVVRYAGINGPVRVRKRRKFRSAIDLIPKWEAVTSHIGRRSFASNFYGKIPTPLLMEATGHSTEQMFKRYINNANTERTRSLGIYFDEVYKEKFLRI